jgi:adhesin transport system outer membrane protein
MKMNPVTGFVVAALMLSVAPVHAQHAGAPAAAADQDSGAPWRHARINRLSDLLGLPAELAIVGIEAEAPKRPMALHETIRQGMNVNLDAQSADARRRAAEFTKRAALGALLPRVDASAGYGKGRLDSVDPILELPRKEASLTIRQAVFDLGAYEELKRQGKLAEAAAYQARSADSAAGLETASAYLQALQARIVIELSEEHEQRLKELLNYVDARAAAGGTSQAESARVRARVANARAVIADSRANLRAALRNLESLVGDAPATLALAVPRSLAIPATSREAKTMAEQQNFDLRAAAADIKASQYEANSQKSKYLPRLEVQGTHRRDVNSGGTEAMLRDNRVMLTATWSLFNGGVDHSQARAATLRGRSIELARASSVRKLGQELDVSYATLDGMQERFDAVSEEMASNAAVVDAFREQLVGGTRPLLDVLDAYQRLHQSRLDLTQLAVSEVQNHIKVSHLVGLLPSMMSADSNQTE